MVTILALRYTRVNRFHHRRRPSRSMGRSVCTPTDDLSFGDRHDNGMGVSRVASHSQLEEHQQTQEGHQAAKSGDVEDAEGVERVGCEKGDTSHVTCKQILIPSPRGWGLGP